MEFVNNNDNIFISDEFGVTVNTGTRNISLGPEALKSNTGGGSNLAIGHRALTSNTVGTENIALGWEALKTNQYSAGNIAIGIKSLQANLDGYGNIGLGNRALYNSSSGYENIGIGAQSLYANLTGYGNVALGDLAGNLGTDDHNCTFIGWHTNNNSGGLIENSTALGQGVQLNASNQIRIGNGNVTSIGGAVGWSIVSDGRIKKNVSENVPGLDLIMKLRPVTYQLDRVLLGEFMNDKESKADTSNSNQYYAGFIAQELYTTLSKLNYPNSIVDVPENPNDLYTVKYMELIASLVKSIQELQVEISILKKQSSVKM
ncbi:MAG: tail fiber domain-containing protein [Saprospiraceae bacterium]|uniref:Tail fiber domain-containing protein n=1 Tax=Candidatus Opimibacter skivensis TaxID=2982028 RepID=A0A9D7SV78_9BACT|nr:tail fiber domain-containing protein [Candidatus Opimibacter skivensis]